MRLGCALVLIALANPLTGCRCGMPAQDPLPASHPPSGSGGTPNRHLIFSPETEETYALLGYGSDWPSSIDSYVYPEITEYRAIIHDRQYRHSAHQDDYYRRFDSVRFGRTVR